MKKLIREITKYFLIKSSLYSLYSLQKKGFLKEKGWFRSFQENASIDKTGNPIPWLTYPCTSFLEQRINNTMTVFEYGSGNSTLWWSLRVRKVVSCEHDYEWYSYIKCKLPKNVELNYVELLEYGGEYCKEISKHQDKFDVVVIDGRDRVNCAKYAIDFLKSDGVIVWDNTEREEYHKGTQYLREKGYKRIDFMGMIPAYTYESCTSIFYKQENCLGI